MLQTESHSATIEHIIEQQTAAWNRGDAEAFSQHMADAVSFTNILGMHFTGRQHFVSRHQFILQGPFKGTQMKQQVTATNWPQPGVAIVNTFISVSGCKKEALPGIFVNEEGNFYTRLLQVLIKKENGWQIVAYHNTDIKAGVAIPELIK